MLFDPQYTQDMIGRATGVRLDANEATILARVLETSAARAVEHIYPGLVARRALPLATNVDEADETVRWEEIEAFGQAELITNHSDDLPNVGDWIESNFSPVESIGAAFSYSTHDLRRAAKAVRSSNQGFVLQPRRIRAADRAIERKIDTLAAQGNAKTGLPGLLNNANVSKISATGTWIGGATEVQILGDLRALASEVFNQSKGVFTATTLLLPIDRFRYIASTPLLPAGDNRITILQAFLDSEQRAGGATINVLPWNECLTADAGNPLACMYEQGPDTAELIVPMGMRAQPPQPNGLMWDVPVEARVGGSLIYQPLAFAYMDSV